MSDDLKPSLPIVKAELGFSMEGRPVALLVDSAGLEWSYNAPFVGFDKPKRAYVFAVEVVSDTAAQQVLMQAPWRPIAGLVVDIQEPVPLPGNESPAKGKKAGKKGAKK